MSLEQDVKDLTAAIRDLMDVMNEGPLKGKEEKEVEEKEEEAKPAKRAPKKTTAKRGTRKVKEKGPELADVRNILREVSSTLSKKEATAMLGEFDCKKVTDLDDGDYAEFIDACKEALEEAGGNGDEEDDDEDDI